MHQGLSKLAVAIVWVSVMLVGLHAAAQQPPARQPAAKGQPQQPATKAPGKSPAQPPTQQAAQAKQAQPTDPDAAKKAEILASPRWRRAIYELGEWFSVQTVYSPEQVAQLKANINRRVAEANSTELAAILNDMDAKLQILDRPELQEARAWLAHYLSILSNKKREEVLKEVPDITKMTAAQLNQEVLRIEQQRTRMEREKSADRRFNQTVSNPWGQTSMEQREYVRDHAASSGGYSSPYRPPSTERPFDNVHLGPDMGFMVGPLGGVSVTYGNRW